MQDLVDKQIRRVLGEMYAGLDDDQSNWDAVRRDVVSRKRRQASRGRPFSPRGWSRRRGFAFAGAAAATMVAAIVPATMLLGHHVGRPTNASAAAI